MRSISKREIEEYLDKVLHEDRPLVIAIKGKWGIGKTFFIKEFLENKFKDKYVYTSLFGKNDVREVIQEIVLNLYSRNQLINKIKRLLGLTPGTASYQTDINKDVSFNLSIGTSLFYSLLSLAEKKDFSGVIIVIDDLERTQINIDEILGLINQLKEEKSSKVILILNEEEIDKENYKRYKEKCIDTEILFDPSLDEIFSLFKNIINKGNQEKIDEYEEIFSNIENYFKELEEKGYRERNLRIFLYIFYKLKEVAFIKDLRIDDYIKETVFQTLVFLFYIKKRNTLAITSEKDLEDYLTYQEKEGLRRIVKNYLTNTKKQQEDTEDEKFSEFIKLQPSKNIFHLRNKEFFSNLLEFWETEIMTENLQNSIKRSLELFQREIQNEAKLKEKSGSVRYFV